MEQEDKTRESLELPKFVERGIVRETSNYRVVMDYKPGLVGQVSGQRFFIEPKTDEGSRMLTLAAHSHHINNFNTRSVTVNDETKERPALRADFITENLPALLNGVTDVPEEDEDSIPSPDRMEECLQLRPDRYTFEDER